MSLTIEGGGLILIMRISLKSNKYDQGPCQDRHLRRAALRRRLRVSYAFTGSIAIATGIALVEPAVNTVVFFFHERAWRRLPAVAAMTFPNTVAVPSGR